MTRVLLAALLGLLSVAALAREPRFLGPPVKKPDAGTLDAGPEDAGDAN